MSRELRTTLAILAIVLIVGSPLIFADAPAAQTTTSYLALVFQDIPTVTPSPVPTPVPPAIQTLVIQLSEMRSGYVRDEFEAVTNAQAAATYHDPKAAAAAFAKQGRETSWYAAYSSADYAFSDAIAVSSQVFRYLTAAGANQGLSYTVTESQRDHLDFRPFNLDAPCCPTIALRRTFKQDSFTLDHFLIISQVGRYVTETESIGLSGSLTVSRAVYYAQLALDHLTNTPQTIQADDLPAPASVPQPGTIDAALMPR